MTENTVEPRNYKILILIIVIVVTLSVSIIIIGIGLNWFGNLPEGGGS